MLQETTDELLSGEGANPGLTCAGVGVTEGDRTMCQLKDTPVTDGHPEDVRCQIFQGSHPIANGLTVNDPVLQPGLIVRP